MYWLGQFCGILSTALNIIRPQMKSRFQMLAVGIGVNLMSFLNFYLIGAVGSAVYMFWIAIVQILLSMRHDRRKTEVTRFENILFFLLYLLIGLWGIASTEGFVMELSWKNLVELLPILGALMNMFSVFAKGEQRIRLLLLICAACWLLYSAIVGAANVFASLASMISTALAMIRYRKQNTLSE